MAYNNIGIIGTGYVGLVTGNCFASTGNNVCCVDIDEEKVEKLKQGICTIYEPGLDRLLESNLKNENIVFTTNLEECVEKCSIIFLCLPTPPNEDGSADLHHVLNMADALGELIAKSKNTEKRIIINKSTVPVGTADKVHNILLKHLPKERFTVVSNPEFLSEGTALEESLKPDRVVIGTTDKWAEDILRNLYAPFVRSGNPIFVMDERSAEITKYAANSFLATKISFMNELSAYCEKVGANIDKIRYGMGADPRIGKMFLYAGIGYGGSCFPKDVRALAFTAREANTPLSIVEDAEKANHRQINRFSERISRYFNDDLSGKKIAIWGLAFKPNTDDVREAPAHKLINFLLERKAQISAFDPEAMENTRKLYGDKVELVEKMYDALNDADVLVICTEWNIFRTPDFEVIKSKLKNNTIFDGRNLFALEDMRKRGINYFSIGRPDVINK